MTHYQLLSRHFQQGYPADEKDNTKRPYAVPHLKSLYVATWEKLISKVIYQGYYQTTNDFEEDREWRDQSDFYTTINQENPVRAALESEQKESGDGTTGQGAGQPAQVKPVPGGLDHVPDVAQENK